MFDGAVTTGRAFKHPVAAAVVNAAHIEIAFDNKTVADSMFFIVTADQTQVAVSSLENIDIFIVNNS